MKLFKKNQVIVYGIVLMLMVAGYLNYTTNTEKQASIETAMQMESADDMQLADIGDATLVNSNDVITENTTHTTSTENLLDQNNTTNTIDSNNNNNNNDNNDDNNNDNNTTTEEMVTPTSSNSNDDYFVKSKLERDTMYSQMIETYEKVLNSSNSLETSKQSATQEIQKINDTKNSIMICENLIKIKGFDDVVVFANGESINVIVKDEQLSAEKVAQIQNIISREMNAKVENIHITNK